MLTPLIALLWLAAPSNGKEEALLRRPSPGAVALLLEHIDDPRAQELVGTATQDEAPATRAMAARVATIGGLVELGPRIAKALAAETNAAAAREQARALLLLDRNAENPVLEAARRLGGASAGDLGLALAAARGALALARIEPLRAAGLPDGRLGDFLELASRDEPTRLSTVGPLALRTRDAVLWSALLTTARSLATEVSAGLLTSALREDDALRGPTLEHLALAGPPGGSRPVVLAQALDAIRAATPLERRPLALELIDRADKRAPIDQTLRIRQAGDEMLPFLQLVYASRPLRGRLSAGEREAVRTRLGLPEKLGELPDSQKATSEGRTLVRLATGYPPGFISDLLTVSGCSPSEEAALGGIFSRDKFGRPTDLAFYGDLAGSPACLTAARILIATHLNPLEPAVRKTGRELLLLPLDPEGLACREESESMPPAASPEPVKVGGKITEPRRTRAVNARYPASAMAARESGVVVLEARLSLTGCVSELEALGAVDVRLLVAALQAVAGWRYTTTLIGGVPVPVIMTVTVHFKLF